MSKSFTAYFNIRLVLPTPLLPSTSILIARQFFLTIMAGSVEHILQQHKSKLHGDNVMGSIQQARITEIKKHDHFKFSSVKLV